MAILNDRALITISAESRALIRAAIRRSPGWRAYALERDVDLSDLTARDAIFDCCDALGIDIAATIAAGAQDEPPPPPKKRGSKAAPVIARRTEFVSTWKNGELPRDIQPSQIIAVLGFDPALPEQDDDDDVKVTMKWDFTIDGEPAAIWDYKGARWSTFGCERIAHLFASPQAPQAPPAPAGIAYQRPPPPTAAPAAPVPQEAATQLLSLIAGLAPKATMDAAAVTAIVGQFVEERVDPAFLEWATTTKALMGRVSAIENREAPAIVVKLQRGDTIAQIEGHHHPKFATLLRALGSRQADGYAPNVWIAGPAGSGKTHAAKMAAKAIGVAWHYNGALSMPHELLGFIDAAGKYHRTPFREAYEHGGVYLFDEVDGSDNSALLALNAALANGTATFPDGQVKRHVDSYIIGTANTWGLGATAEYVGRSKIDAAFLSRFPVRLAWDYDEPLERNISGNEAFAKRVQRARAMARSAGLKVLIDPRASIAGAALIANGASEAEAAELTYLANLTAEQRRMVGEG